MVHALLSWQSTVHTKCWGNSHPTIKQPRIHQPATQLMVALGMAGPPYWGLSGLQSSAQKTAIRHYPHFGSGAQILTTDCGFHPVAKLAK